MERQPLQIEALLPVLFLTVPSGWVFRSMPGGFLAFPSFPVVWPACKIFSDKEAGKQLPRKGKKKFSDHKELTITPTVALTEYAAATCNG